MNRAHAMTFSFRAVLILCVLWSTPGINAQDFRALASFPVSLGDYPSSLIQGTNGGLYGTTAGYGTQAAIFEYTPEGKLKARVTNYGSGEPLLLDANGNYYGTSYDNGSNGFGAIFSINQAGQTTTLYSFNVQDGQAPNSLVQVADGSFFGTTAEGGSSERCIGDGYSGCGTVFKLALTGQLTTLHSFNLSDGELPSGLMQASDGNFYGVTQDTLFEITTNGDFRTLYTFCVRFDYCPNGSNPDGPLVEGLNGNFYGTTIQGGANCLPAGCGTVFRITPEGKITTLYSFCAQTNCSDGSYPLPLVRATDGSFYGVTAGGGGSNCFQGCGTIFKVTPAGELTTLYSFCPETNCPDGYLPAVALAQATNGVLNGTTSYGGAYSNGTIFGLSVGLAPFVQTIPTAGKIGRKVIILGNNLTGATSITFNGTEAAFDVVSETEIIATVPSDATTGEVEVTTPNGTLSSNVAFRIL